MAVNSKLCRQASAEANLSRLKAWALGRLLLPFAAAVRMVPETQLPALGDRVGDALYAVSKKLRTVALANLARVYGDVWSDEQILQIARKAFRNFGRTAVEFIRLPYMSPDKIRMIVKIEGLECMFHALEAGRGCILITAHYGNWEMLGARLVLEGLEMNVLARSADDSLTDRFINGIRSRVGLKVLSRGGSLIPVLRALKRNEVVGILLDQNFVNGIFVDFFGRPAATATGPAELAIRTGAPVVSGFIERQADNTHLARFEPIELPSTAGDYEENVRAATQVFTKVIEDAVRRRPDQWMWFHNRWKCQPQLESC